MAAASDAPGGPISVDVDIADGRTTITVSGETEASVVVRSASGERVYLPPERTPDTDGPDPYRPAEGESPYEGVTADSPYEGVTAESPYDGTDGPSEVADMTPTADGFRIVHPEPITDFRFLR